MISTSHARRRMKAIIQSLKGTRDFYPDEMAVRKWLYGHIQKVSESFGYQEFEGPYLEKVELYAAKSGDELVKQQSFAFTDRGGEMITLRPELTPTLARMVAQKQNELAFPLRWWSYGPFWRYERPQKGRTREFFQWNIDLIGVSNAVVDAELVTIAARFFQLVGLKPEQAGIFINDRQMMNVELEGRGIPAGKMQAVLRVIDHKKKMEQDAWEAYAAENELAREQVKVIRELLKEEDLWKRSETLTTMLAIISELEIKEFVKFDAQIIRGLDYYTGMVFEAFDPGEEGRAILGGGHYDNLVAAVGGQPLPGVGFAMGDVVLGQVLEKYGCVPADIKAETVLMTVFSQDYLMKSIFLANQMREMGIRVAVFPEAAKLEKQLKYADRNGHRLAVVYGPDEEKDGMLTVKDMLERQQEKISLAGLAARYFKILEKH
jgi:histidyl-tRNA synthetase